MSKKSNPNKSAAPTDWSEVADWYDQLVGESGSEFHQHVVLPGTLRLLNPQPVEKVLDIACGQGVLCRLLSQRGIDATGVDSAKDLVQLARVRDPKREERYIVGDARNLSFLPEGKFDSAACILAIQNINPIQPVFQSTARVLKQGGKLVIVMMHPCFRSPKETSWGWDDASKVQYRRVDRYLVPRKHPITTHPGQKSGEYTWTFHKPIGDYVKFLRNAGLLVDAMEEWASHKMSDSGPRAAAENTARKEIPMFLAIRAIKLLDSWKADTIAPPTDEP